MDVSDVEETRPLLFNPDIPVTTQNTRRPYETQIAVYFILTIILFESIGFYSFTGNLAPALRQSKTLNWTSPHGSHASYIFSGTEFFSMLVFALVSDGILSRGKTIIMGFPLYLTGFILFTIITSGKTSLCHFHKINNQTVTSIIHEQCASSILPILILTGIGTGSVRANIIALGGDQIQGSRLTSRYIDKFVMTINVASIIETLTETYISHDQNYLNFYLFGLSMACVAALLFIIGWRYYAHATPYKSVVTNCIPVLSNAFQSWRQYRQNKRYTESTDINIPARNCWNDNNILPNDEEEEVSVRIDGRPSAFLDYAKLINNGNFQDWIVDDVKVLRNALIIFLLVFPYRFIFYQLYSTFQYQAGTMKYSKLETSNLIFLIEPVTIIIGIIILNIFGYRYLRTRNYSLTIATKFVLSMFFAFITMNVAGGVEILRQHYCIGNHTNSDLPIYTQTIQYVGMGIAQLFGLLASFEFAYFVAPRSAQSLFMSLHFVSRGVASYIGVGYFTIVNNHSFDLHFYCPSKSKYPWHYFTYFFVVASIQLIFIIIFVLCQRKFRMISLNRQ